jgi:hypothetical protein
MFERRRALLPLRQPSYSGKDKATRVLDKPPTARGIAYVPPVSTEGIVVMADESQAHKHHTEQDQYATCELIFALPVPLCEQQ